MNTLRRCKVLNGYAAHARFCDELGADRGWIVALDTPREPFRSGPTKHVAEWRGLPVVWFETAHRRYEVFEVVDGPIYQNESDATAVFAAAYRSRLGL